MNKALENRNKKHDYEIMFLDSPEYFVVTNCKMIQEYKLVKFICFDENNKYKEEVWYPYEKIHRIKKYRNETI